MTTPQADLTVVSASERVGDFLSPEDLAEYLGIPLATVYQWRQKKYGPPAAKVGKHLRYRKAAVDAWVMQQERAAS